MVHANRVQKYISKGVGQCQLPVEIHLYRRWLNTFLLAVLLPPVETFLIGGWLREPPLEMCPIYPLSFRLKIF